MRRFDPERWRTELQASLIAMEAARQREDYLPNAVGNAARAGVELCVYAWLAGLRDEVAPILAKYRDWLADAIARNETFGQPPAYFAALRLEALAIAGWMLDGTSDPSRYGATLPLYEATWADPANRAGTAADCLRNCVLAGQPQEGLAVWARAGSPETAEVALALDLCRADWGCSPADPALLDRAGVVLSRHLAGDWLGRGHALRAALWLKAVYFVGGVVADPEATLLRAYTLMTGVERPTGG